MKAVNTKRALNRAWKLIKNHGVDKAVAFDISWKMERNELPKTKTKQGNPIIKFVSQEDMNKMNLLLIEINKMALLSSVDGMTMDDYRSPQQRAGYKSALVTLVKHLEKLTNKNGISGYLYSDNRMKHMYNEDIQVQMVVGY